jgi:hypothetical protein
VIIGEDDVLLRDGFIDAVGRVASGGSALDPEVVARMLGRRGSHGPLAALTPGERNVLARDGGRQVEPGHRRRVLAVLSYLRSLAS